METGIADRLRRVANSSTLTLTHYGRKSGKPYRVTIWFLVDRDRLYLATADVRRNWVKNVLVNPRVSLKIGGETFEGSVQRITDKEAREHLFSLVQSKYWYALPFIVVGRMLQGLGLMENRSGAFEVVLQSGAKVGSE